MKYYEFPVILVATKADKLAKSKKNQQIERIKDVLDFDENDTFVVFSTVTKYGKEEAWQAIETFI
ncbi:hypothetical protein GCM10025857_59510 [Alicyclobacillus contaminans]|nr:hypothetical protein GCM10025857_59510 [Alicyclobacillus contaminans]